MNKVRLIATTKPEVEGLISSEDLVSYCARVSNPNNQLNTETGVGLLNYCLRHKHFSIFEMANVVVEINTTRDISRQILRHRSLSFQEFSGRYSEMDNELVPRETRMQDVNNKQGSLESTDDYIVEHFTEEQKSVWKEAVDGYNYMLSLGIAKEQARALLPEGLVKTRMYANGTLRSWIHYCQVRCGIETQKEHRMIAKQVCQILIEQFPVMENYLSCLLEDGYSAEH